MPDSTNTLTSPVTVTDNDTYAPQETRTEDNLDGDVNVTINANSEVKADPCGCASVPCACADRGHADYVYPAVRVGRDCGCQPAHGHAPHSVNVTVRKTNTTFNFGGSFVPAGYFNNQGGGQGASVTAAQQEVAAPKQCCDDSDTSGASGSGSSDDDEGGITNTVNNETNNTYNNTYNNTTTNRSNNSDTTADTTTSSSTRTATEGDFIQSENL